MPSHNHKFVSRLDRQRSYRRHKSTQRHNKKRARAYADSAHAGHRGDSRAHPTHPNHIATSRYDK